MTAFSDETGRDAIGDQVCAGSIDPGFDDCPKCGASMDEGCKYGSPPLSLREALQNLEAACERLATSRSHEAYLAMVDAGQSDDLCELDSARAKARAALSASPVGEPALRMCGYCKTWNSKPCGEQCYLQPSDPVWTAPVETWKCAARKQSLPEPADCGWPTCGCDPHADKVIAALEEQGQAAPVAQEPVAQMTFFRAMGLAERGFENWKAKEHNAKWFKRIDGTPIPNDLLVNIAEAFCNDET